MGTSKEQAELWAPGARDWADYNEPTCTPFYEAVLDATGVGEGTNLLDVGCGGGFAILLAALRGATVSGLDAVPVLRGDRSGAGARRIAQRRAISRTRCRSRPARSTWSPRSTPSSSSTTPWRPSRT